MVGTRVTPRLINKVTGRANERKKEAWQAKGILLNWLTTQEYKVDYS